jgi:hypothetical protein
MVGKPKINPRDTYVFDPDEIDQLDELSLTSVMRQVCDPLELPQNERDGNALNSEIAPSASAPVDTTINELLERSISMADLLSDTRPHSISEAATEPKPVVESLDDLIAPELLFPEETGDIDDDEDL